MEQTFKLYKLIILHLLDKVDFPLTTSQISDFVLGRGYMTSFFKFQQTLSELCEDGFLTVESTHNRTFYHITEDGAQTVHYFRSDIPVEFQQDIDRFLKEKKYDLKNDFSVKADYYTNTNQEFSVHCQVMERGLPLIDLSIAVPTKAQAEKIANNWIGKNEEIYAMIMEKLL